MKILTYIVYKWGYLVGTYQTKKLIRRAQNLKNSGYSNIEIANQLNISESNVRRVVR